jgi:hypothetical protein
MVKFMLFYLELKILKDYSKIKAHSKVLMYYDIIQRKLFLLKFFILSII